MKNGGEFSKFSQKKGQWFNKKKGTVGKIGGCSKKGGYHYPTRFIFLSVCGVCICFLHIYHFYQHYLCSTGRT